MFKFQCPETVYYISSFLSRQDEEMILANVDNTPKPKWTQLSNRRVINYGGVPHPHGMIAEELPKWLKDKVVTLNNLGEFMLLIRPRKLTINSLFYHFAGLFDKAHANHVLVNEYLPGQGIMAHSDGPLFYPVVCTISCGSHAVLEFYEKENDEDDNKTPSAAPMTTPSINGGKLKRKLVFQLLIEPGSLLILKDEMYNKYLHSISDVTEDLITNNIANIERCAGFKNRIGEFVKRERRISLTIRHVPKTSKLKLRLGH